MTQPPSLMIVTYF